MPELLCCTSGLLWGCGTWARCKILLGMKHSKWHLHVMKNCRFWGALVAGSFPGGQLCFIWSKILVAVLHGSGGGEGPYSLMKQTCAESQRYMLCGRGQTFVFDLTLLPSWGFSSCTMTPWSDLNKVSVGSHKKHVSAIKMIQISFLLIADNNISYTGLNCLAFWWWTWYYKLVAWLKRSCMSPAFQPFKSSLNQSGTVLKLITATYLMM